jgi:hypothetical protein
MHDWRQRLGPDYFLELFQKASAPGSPTAEVLLSVQLMKSVMEQGLGEIDGGKIYDEGRVLNNQAREEPHGASWWSFRSSQPLVFRSRPPEIDEGSAQENEWRRPVEVDQGIVGEHTHEDESCTSTEQ